MRILHTGDVHLDSPFAGLDIARAEMRRVELRETFSRMMRFAKDEKIDMVIISGDLFDGAFVTRETVQGLIRDFSSLSCPVVIAPGNHDPADESGIWNKTVFPDNVHIFKSNSLERLSFDELSCDVYGYAFTSSYQGECLLRGSVEDSARINILAAHGDTSSPISSKAPLPVAALRVFGADWAALGHIHTPDAANTALGALGAYCGCPEGRDFGECGLKGALIIDIEKNGSEARVNVEKKRFCKRIYRAESINIDGACDTGSVAKRISAFVKNAGLGEETLLRVTLCGSVEPSLVINTKLLSEASLGLFHLEVEDATSPTWNAHVLMADCGIRGELYRTLLPELESADSAVRKRAALALRYSLAALAGEELSDV